MKKILVASVAILSLFTLASCRKNEKEIEQPNDDVVEKDNQVIEEEPYTTFDLLEDTWYEYYPSDEVWPTVELEDYDLAEADYISDDDKKMIDSSHYLYISDNPEELTAIALHAKDLEFDDFIWLTDRINENLKANKDGEVTMVANVNKEYIVIIKGTEFTTNCFIAAINNTFEVTSLFDQF